MKRIAILAVSFLLVATAAGQQAYDVVWDTPGSGYGDSMPLGNGDIGLNAWVECDGDVVFYIGKTDAWGDNGRLLKVGRVRVSLDPCPRVEGAPFQQALRLEDATMRVRFGEGDGAVRLEVWVDANEPVIHVSAVGPKPMTATAAIELWRLERETLPSIEVSDVMLHRSHPDGWYAPTVVEPDTVLTDLDEGIGWYHHNRKSVGPALTAKIQGTSGFERIDPLLHRTFGAVIRSPGSTRIDATHLRTPLGTSQRFDVFVQSEHPATPEAWLEGLEKTIADVESRPFATRRGRPRGVVGGVLEAQLDRCTGGAGKRPGDLRFREWPRAPYRRRSGRGEPLRRRDRPGVDLRAAAERRGDRRPGPKPAGRGRAGG